jgi:LemA protein
MMLSDLYDGTAMIAVAVGALSLVLIVGLGRAVMRFYNDINPLSHRLHESEANTEVSMQKLVRLSNGLIDIASRYATHEGLIHLQISKDRKDAARYYQRSRQTIALIAQLATQFPMLKADTTYLQLMTDVRSLETELQMRYEAYNAVAREYNSRRTTFPSVLFAAMLRLRKAPYLDPSLWYPR